MKKLKFHIICILALCSPSAMAQYYTLKWTRTIGNKGWELVSTAVRDTSCNFYIAGSTCNNALSDQFLTTAHHNRQAFILKTDSSGLHVWTRYLGDKANCDIHSMQYNDNTIYVSGSFSDTLVIDGFRISASGRRGVFIAAFSSDGITKWLKKLGSENIKPLRSNLCISPDGKEIYIMVTFSGDIIRVPQKKNPVNQVKLAVFKLSSEGLHSEYFICNSDKEIVGTSMLFNQNKLFLAGRFKGDISFNDKLIQSAGGYDAFIAVLTDSLKPLRISTYGSFLNDEVSNLILDCNNDIIAAGSFMESVWFNPEIITAKGCKDIFLLKADSALTIQWVKQISGKGNERVYSLGSGHNGDILVSGSHSQDCIFNLHDVVKDIPKSESGFNNAFLAIFSSQGVFLSSVHFPGTSETTCKAILTDSNNDLYCIGNFTGKISVPSYDKKASSSSYHTRGDQDIFMTNYAYSCDNINLNLNNDSVLCGNNSLTIDAGPEYVSYQWMPSGNNTRFEHIHQPGWYAVTVKDTFGCIAKDSIQLTLSEYPLVYAGKDTSITRGKVFQCKSAFIKNTTAYYWTTRGNGTFDDHSRLHPIYYPAMSDLLGDRIILELHGLNDCGEHIDTISIDLFNEGIVTVSPNPTTGMVTLYTNQENNTFGFVDILTGEGTLLKRLTSAGLSSLSVDLSQYPSGTYLIRYGNNAGSGIFRISKL